MISSVALQVPEPHGITLALDSVFSRSAWHIRLCRPTNLISGRTPSLSQFQRHSFYFQHCQYKTSASCLSYRNNRKNILTNEKLINLDSKLWHLCSSYVPTCSSVSAFNGPSKTRFNSVYLTYDQNINLTTRDVHVHVCSNYVYGTNK